MENEFDLDALEQEFESEFSEEEEETDEDLDTQDEETDDSTTDDEADSVADEDSETDEVEETDEEQEEEPNQDGETVTDETPKLNTELETYKSQLEQLQTQLEESKRAAALIDEIATQNGVSRDELIKQYEAQKIKDQAEKEGIPVEYLERQRAMETELSQLKESQIRERFNTSVASVRDKYNLSEKEITDTIDYAVKNGIDVFNPAVNFEAIYKATNFDKLLEQQVKESRQKELSAKQERMKKSAVSHGGSASPSAPSVDDEVQSFLREQGII